ncbi:MULTISPECIES: molybdopterin-dependent oxidoreductase [unclassified Variovorax]|uniref:molybdopterin-dependent oxidoreductase n=1 Tax=unclassified Variovorax TaxID=663243 RepID=UPI003F474464
MARYTLSHWGLYEVEKTAAGEPSIAAYRHDPDPSAIGLHQFAPELSRLRVRKPAVRRSWLENGPGANPELRGREPFVEVEWEEAFSLVAAEIERVRTTHGNSAIFGGSYGWASAGRFHHAQSQIHRFLNAAGGYVRHKDSYSLGAAHVIMPHVVAGMDELISIHHTWDVLAEHTKLLVTFGGVPRKNAQSSPGGVGRHRVRDGLASLHRAAVRIVNLGPVNDNIETGGPIEWIQLRPNTDVAMMMALCWVLRDEKLHDVDFLSRYCVGYINFEAYLLGATDGIAKTPQWAATITGVPAEVTYQLARDMAKNRTMLNVAWSLQRAERGEQPFWGVVTLACMLGQIGLPGGGFGAGYGPANTMGTPHRKIGGPTLSQGFNPVTQFIPVARIADLLIHPTEAFTYNGTTYTYPDIRMVYWAGGNPFHHHQDLNRLVKAWQRPETIVFHEQYWTAAAKFSDIVLPATTSLERDDIGYASQEGVLVWMSKTTEAVGYALSDYDIFAGIASKLGCADVFTEGRSADAWLRVMYEDLVPKYDRVGIALPDFEAFKELGLIDLDASGSSHVMFSAFREDPLTHPLKTRSGLIEITCRDIESFQLSDCVGHAAWLAPTEWLGSDLTGKYPLHLLTDQPRNKLHSQLDASPHSMASKVHGREPVYLSADDAGARGIQHGDLVRVFNDRGACLAIATVSADVMSGVCRISTGSWYDPDPDTGLDKHGNPNVLTNDVPASGLSQGCAAQSCLVQLERFTGEPPPVTAFELPAFADRADDSGI